MAAKGKRVRAAKAAPRAKGKVKGQLARRRGNAAYRRANHGRVDQVKGAIEAALAEGAELREAISRKIERRIATAETRDRRTSRRR